MQRRERLLSTLNGLPIDRPAVSFYEINGLDEDFSKPDPYNIYNHPSWYPLIELAREKSDRIVMRSVPFKKEHPDIIEEIGITESIEIGDSIYQKTTLQVGGKKLTSTTRRDRDVNTIWQIEHLLKGLDDLKAFLSLPFGKDFGIPDISCVLETEKILEDTGIVMIDTADPICMAASLFDLGTFTILATQEKYWFHLLLDRFAEELTIKTELISDALPGRLWRIYGPEYASPPYLSPKLFYEYVTFYDEKLVRLIQKNNGYARIHSHGKLKLIIEEIVSMNCDGLDPIEPPPQGDMQISEVKERFGDQLVLFGNLEANDLELLPTNIFEEKIRTALCEGANGKGRGFVLMPSSCPYGRILPDQALRNYERMIRIVEEMGR
jgi:hypothetical protein